MALCPTYLICTSLWMPETYRSDARFQRRANVCIDLEKAMPSEVLHRTFPPVDASDAFICSIIGWLYGVLVVHRPHPLSVVPVI